MNKIILGPQVRCQEDGVDVAPKPSLAILPSYSFFASLVATSLAFSEMAFSMNCLAFSTLKMLLKTATSVLKDCRLTCTCSSPKCFTIFTTLSTLMLLVSLMPTLALACPARFVTLLASPPSIDLTLCSLFTPILSIALPDASVATRVAISAGVPLMVTVVLKCRPFRVNLFGVNLNAPPSCSISSSMVTLTSGTVLTSFVSPSKRDLSSAKLTFEASNSQQQTLPMSSQCRSSES
mmetsp:Transcript_71777/g.171500  ORF Transcript_71777/g.171500 Transcript_71777/m.171500 type:complete len:236 (-) Transcript_71777:70-777(-)